MNPRHKAILFVTLVLTGSSLLAGAELKEALGMMMLGVALAWAVGSEVVSKSYLKLRGFTNSVYLWIRLPLVMFIAGCILGVVLLFSKANPVLAIAVMSLVGIIIAPLTSLPTRRVWLRILLILLAPFTFLLGVGGITTFDKSAEQYAEKFGQLSGQSFVVMLVGIWWLSKGWKLIHKGMTSEAAAELVAPERLQGKTVGQYVSLFLGVIILSFWLGLLAWLPLSDWAYAPANVTHSKANQNVLPQVGFVLLLALWPYAAWKKILSREPNSEPRYLRRHKRVVAVAGMIFTVVLCIAITFGIQNGNDRTLTNEIEKGLAEYKDVATKIVSIKQRDLKTTSDYIEAYFEIETLQPELDSTLQHFEDIWRKARLRDESRGPINIQRFYKSHTREYLQNISEMFELLRKASALTKQETLAAKRMATLPEQDQVQFWQLEFKPLLEQEDALRGKMLAVQAKLEPARNTK